MMIYKHPIIGRPCVIDLHKGTTIVHFAKQDVDAWHAHMYIWVMFDQTVTDTEKRTFHIVGTGQSFPDGIHRGTAFDGPFVWHLIEEGKDAVEASANEEV